METRALLLTDLVDSDRMVEELGAERAAALGAAHDRCARDLLPPHRGREIDKAEGFLLLFEAAADAIAYASAYHEAIAPLGLRARAGLHVAPVVLRENTPADVARGAKPLEVDGIGKAVAARAMSIAHGGQTVVTREAAVGADATSLGHWTLKGLLAPIELFAVGAPGPPPSDGAKAWRVHRIDGAWVPVRDVRRHLPAERDAFVGRDADLLEIASHLAAGARLLTVLGTGGTGKTRLVVRFGWNWLGEWPGGVWFCDLSEARSEVGIVAAVARALDVPLSGADPVAQLGHAIAGRGTCLVVLDNVEQVARFAPGTLGRWLEMAGDARVVVTSREVLGLPGEAVLALGPLDEADAVALFAARASQARRDFTPSARDEADVRALVRLLDCLPLAIELAAARIRIMPPHALLLRMTERFRLLGGTSGRGGRHGTLRAALDWSWDLLSPDERAALAQLAVFEGGFGLEAASAVLQLEEIEPVEAVRALVDKSLVRSITDERFDLLVSVQEYAAERLEEAGGRLGAQVRHGAYFAAWGRGEAAEALHRAGGVARRRAMAEDLDNLAAACRRAIARADAAVAVPALQAAWAVIELRGPMTLGAELAHATCAMQVLAPTERGAVACVAGTVAQLQGRPEEARARFEEAIALSRAAGDRRGEATALGKIGALHRDCGRAQEARASLEAAIAVSRALGDRRLEAGALGNLGIVHREQGRMDEALALYESALAQHRALGNRPLEGTVLGMLGTLYLDQGRLHEAAAHYEAALAVHREVGNRRLEGIVLGNLALVYESRGDAERALAGFEAARAVTRDVGDRRNEAVALCNVGCALQGQGRLDEAEACLRESLGVLREVGYRRFESSALGRLGEVAWARGLVEVAGAHLEEALAIDREVGNRRGEGRTLRVIGELRISEGRRSDARAALEAAVAAYAACADHPSEAHVMSVLAETLEDGEAEATIARAEALAGAQPDPALAALLVAARAELRWRAGDVEAARSMLDHAGDLTAHPVVVHRLLWLRSKLSPASG